MLRWRAASCAVSVSICPKPCSKRTRSVRRCVSTSCTSCAEPSRQLTLLPPLALLQHRLHLLQQLAAIDVRCVRRQRHRHGCRLARRRRRSPRAASSRAPPAPAALQPRTCRPLPARSRRLRRERQRCAAAGGCDQPARSVTTPLPASTRTLARRRAHREHQSRGQRRRAPRPAAATRRGRPEASRAPRGSPAPPPAVASVPDRRAPRAAPRSRPRTRRRWRGGVRWPCGPSRRSRRRDRQPAALCRHTGIAVVMALLLLQGRISPAAASGA